MRSRRRRHACGGGRRPNRPRHRLTELWLASAPDREITRPRSFQDLVDIRSANSLDWTRRGTLWQMICLLCSSYNGAIPMRQQRRQRTTPVASSPQAAPTRKVSSGLPETGYALIVDGRAKSEFKTKEDAENEARELKQRFPMLQIKVYDAEAKCSEEIVPSVRSLIEIG